VSAGAEVCLSGSPTQRHGIPRVAVEYKLCAASRPDFGATRTTFSVKRSIPAVWRIDVEPDEHQPDVRQKPWQGFVSIAALVEKLRERLASRSGHAVHLPGSYAWTQISALLWSDRFRHPSAQ
jgi:hypothetical protein